MTDDDDSYLIDQVACPNPDCGSSDAFSRYSSGWGKCFSCGINKPWDRDSVEPVQRRRKEISNQPFIEGEVTALEKRGISEETCKKTQYWVGRVPKDYPASKDSFIGQMKGKQVQIANFYDDNGALVAQQLRDRNKNFATIGKVSKYLWNKKNVPAGQKMVVITEGMIDALSYKEVRPNWPVLSLPNGAEAAAKALKANLDYLESFGKVVLAFDKDKDGEEALQACCGVLSPGKLYKASLEGYKDFNEALDQGDAKAILQAVWNAEENRPDGLVSIDDIMEEAAKPVEWGLPWFIDKLTQLTYGRRFGEVYGLGGGTGTGKTDVFTEQAAFDIFTLKEPVGFVYLEQKPVETAKRAAGKVANRRFHVPDGDWTQEELKDALLQMKGKVTFYDSFGQTDWDRVKNRIRHMAVGQGVRIFYVDHLTAMADTSDERGSIEQIMKEMAGLADELQIIIHFISHLSTPDGTPHEEGGRVAIRHFKGSRSIGFWSFFMFGLERDQQAEDEEERHTTTFRILKDRYTGQATGHCIELGYDDATGRIYPKQGQSHDYGDARDEDF